MEEADDLPITSLEALVDGVVDSPVWLTDEKHAGWQDFLEQLAGTVRRCAIDDDMLDRWPALAAYARDRFLYAVDTVVNGSNNGNFQRRTTQSPMTRTSILVRRKQSSASSGRHTTGSFSLNDVFRTIGTPVMSLNLEISRWYLRLVDS